LYAAVQSTHQKPFPEIFIKIARHFRSLFEKLHSIVN